MKLPFLTRVAFLSLALLMVALVGCSKQSKADRAFARAEKDRAAGQSARAEIEYITALRFAPADTRILSALGFLYLDQGRVSQAYICLERVVQLAPDNLIAREQFARLLQSYGQRDKAREQAAFLIGKDPGNDWALVILADSAKSGDEMADCLRRIESLPEGKRRGMAAHLARGSLLFRQNKLSEAEAELNQAAAADPMSERPHTALASLHLARGDLTRAESEMTLAADLAPPRSSARIFLARFKVQSGKVAEAREIVAGILKVAPDYIPALVAEAQIALAEKRTDECFALLKKILAADPGNYEAVSLDGSLSFATGNITNAITRFERIVELFGPTPEHTFNLATAYAKNGQDGKALATIDIAVNNSTNFVDAILFQSSLLLKQGSFAPVVTSLTHLLANATNLPPAQRSHLPQAFQFLAAAYSGQKNTSAAVSVFEQLRHGQPKGSEALLQAAEGLSGLGKPDAARAAYLDFVAGSTNAFGLLVAGEGLIRLKQFNDARVTLEKAAALDPNNPTLLVTLVITDLLEAKFSSAIERVQLKIQQDPANAVAYSLLGRVYLDRAVDFVQKASPNPTAEPSLSGVSGIQDDLQKSEAALLKAAELQPVSTGAENLLARLWVDAGKDRQAIARLVSVVAVTNHAPSFMQLALIHSKLGDSEAAASYYERLLQFSPDFVPALNNLAGIYGANPKQQDRALELARKARALAKTSPAIADTLGWVLHQRGQYAEASDFLEEALAALPNEPEVRFHRGMNDYMLGLDQKAQVALETALKSPDPFAGKDRIPGTLAILRLDPASAESAAMDALQKRLSELPNDPVALMRLAACQEKVGGLDQAARTYETLLQFYPKNIPASLRLARLYADNLNALDKALELAKNARELAPADPEAAHLFGRLLYAKGDTTWALSLLEESARKLPSDPAVAYDLAVAEYAAGQVGDAIVRMGFASSSEGFPKSKEAAQFLAFVAAAAEPGKAAQLSAELPKTLVANPKYLPALVLAASIKVKEKDYLAAARDYERILSFYPSFSPAIKSLALLYSETPNQDQKTYELAIKARESYPGDPDLAKALGVLAHRKADYSRSATLLGEASLKLTQDPEIFYYLGLAHYHLKAGNQARQALQKAIELSLAEPMLAEAKRVLADL